MRKSREIVTPGKSRDSWQNPGLVVSFVLKSDNSRCPKRQEKTMSVSRILYIDDDHESCEMLATMLELSTDHYHVVTANSGEEALEIIESTPFDLYVIDYMLPKMDGLTLCRTLRDARHTEPIIVFSAVVHPNDSKFVVAAGANEFLRKPNDLDIFIDTVNRLLLADA
jgi:CheY-like chemotaxis protein